MKRDFTYIDDIAEGVVSVLDRSPSTAEHFNRSSPDPAGSWAPYRILNIGNNSPVELLEYVEALEQALGKTAQRNLLPMQLGDVKETFADTSCWPNARIFHRGQRCRQVFDSSSTGIGRTTRQEKKAGRLLRSAPEDIVRCKL